MLTSVGSFSTWTVFLAATTFGRMQMDQSRSAAAVAVLALRTSLADLPELLDGRWLLLPEEQVVTDSQLIDFLASMPKPIQCSAKVVKHRAAVACESRVTRAQTEFSRQQIEKIVTRLQAAHPSASEHTVLVEGLGEPMLVTFEVYRSFGLDYNVLFTGETYKIAPPTPGAIAAGAQMSLRFSSARSIEAKVEITVDGEPPKHSR